MDLLVVGLGNPGQKYINNRHNVGFKVIELLSKQLNIKFKKQLFKPFEICKTNLNDQKIIFVKPLTFMNRSGSIIPFLLKHFKLKESNLLIITDNMDLDPGRCKLKLKGSPAAHNGLKSVSFYIKSNDYMRLYIGIGHPGKRDEVINYVIGDPPIDELDLYNESFNNAAQAVLKISEGFQEQVMNEINRKKSGKKCL